MNEMNEILLVNDSPLLLLPSLAVAIGVNEAIVLQEVHRLTRQNKAENNVGFFKDGRWWFTFTRENWSSSFPWMTQAEAWPTIQKLRKGGLLIAEAQNKSKFNPGFWYAVDYKAFAALGLSPLPLEDTP